MQIKLIFKYLVSLRRPFIYAVAMFVCIGNMSIPSMALERFAPAAESFTLDNGMQVVVIPDHRVPVVTHVVFYKVGSADEVSGKTGIAHFLEHLLFKGTKAYPDDSFSKMVAMRGGEQNAMTSSDYTAYYQRIPKAHLPLMMRMEADRMVNLVLNEEGVLAERDVVLEERLQRIENNPVSQLHEEMSAALYRVHPYGQPIIGWEHEIGSLSLQDVLDFYGKFYSPDNAVLVVAGDIQVDEVRQLAQDTYGRLPRSSVLLKDRRRSTEPPQRSQRRVTLYNRMQQPMFKRYYDVPSYTAKDNSSSFALNVLSQILGGGPTSRLYQDLVVKRGIATSVQAEYAGYQLDSGLFRLYAIPGDGIDISKIEDGIDRQLELISRDGVTYEELQRSRNLLLANTIYTQDSQFSLAMIFGVFLTIGMSVEDVQSWPEGIMSVTTEDVRQAALMLHPDSSSSVVGVMLPRTSGENNSTDGVKAAPKGYASPPGFGENNSTDGVKAYPDGQKGA